MFANPFYAINIAPILAQPHETLVDKKTFVEVGVRQILEDDNGNDLDPSLVPDSIRQYLYTLLDVLEGNYLTNDNTMTGYTVNEN
jgi:hypothetical protein